MEWNANQLELDTPEAAAILRRKARKLARLRILGDEEDVAQELTLRLLRKQVHYNASRGQPHAFLRMLVNHEATSWLRYERAKRRFQTKVVSLDAPSGGDDFSLADVVADPSSQRVTPLNSELRQDVVTLISQLSRRDRHLCRLAMRYSIMEIARITGVPRTTIQSRLYRLRSKFAGLRISR